MLMAAGEGKKHIYFPVRAENGTFCCADLWWRVILSDCEWNQGLIPHPSNLAGYQKMALLLHITHWGLLKRSSFSECYYMVTCFSNTITSSVPFYSH